MTLSVKAQLKLAEWSHNLEVLIGQMAELGSEMYELAQRRTALNQQIESCPGSTADQLLLVEQWTERLGRMNHAGRIMQFKLDCMKNQRRWYEHQIQQFEQLDAERSQAGSTNGRGHGGRRQSRRSAANRRTTAVGAA